MFKKVLATGAMLAVAVSAAQAQTTIVYSNIDNFGGQGYANGGATSATGTTTLVADDINAISGFAGDEVTAFAFSVANFNTAAAAASPIVSFFDSDPTTGDPGALLASVTFNPVTLNGDSVGLFTATSPTGFFTLPSDTFFAGISFTGATTTTVLNNFGQGLFDPPTVGTSQDAFFQSNGPDTGSSSPAGGDFFFGGSPVANFGWEFGVTPAATPEPSQYAAFALGILGVGALALKARRRSVTA